ncbi:MAG: TlpA family protein disulfide reductase [Bacteroidales bacterium]|nr:TlpA family protein disulfide reductase [Bacteroidales bacterium]
MSTKTILSIVILTLAFNVVKAQSIPDFMLENLDGEWVSYNDLKGDEVTLIDFWASWCKPCMKAMPEIDKIYQEYHNKGLSAIGINTDGPRSISKVRPLSKTLNISYPIVSDINNELLNDLNISVLPTLLLVNKNGEIIYRHEGWTAGDEKELVEQINSILQ